MNRHRRLTIRTECRADLHLAFATLACVLVCLGQIRQFCWVFLRQPRLLDVAGGPLT